MFNVTFLLASKNNRIFSNPFLCQNLVFRRVIIWGSITPSSYMRQPFLDKIKQSVLNTCELMLQMFERLVFHTENLVEGSLLAVFLSSCRPSVYFLSQFSVHSTRSLKMSSKYFVIDLTIENIFYFVLEHLFALQTNFQTDGTKAQI